MFVGIAQGTKHEDGAEKLQTLQQLEDALRLFLRVIELDENTIGEGNPRLARHLLANIQSENRGG